MRSHSGGDSVASGIVSPLMQEPLWWRQCSIPLPLPSGVGSHQYLFGSNSALELFNQPNHQLQLYGITGIFTGASVRQFSRTVCRSTSIRSFHVQYTGKPRCPFCHTVCRYGCSIPVHSVAYVSSGENCRRHFNRQTSLCVKSEAG